MMRKIRVYGELAKFLGCREFEAVAANVGEAMRFLLANFPSLDQHMTGQHYRVLVGTTAIGIEEIDYPVGQRTIRIVPVVAGAGGVGKIIAGIAIIGLSILTAGAFGFALGSVTGIGTFASIGVGIGVSLALGGVSQLLTPVPKLAAPSMVGPTSYSPGFATPSTRDTELDPQKSYSFSGIQNTSRTGATLPLIYGETIVGSIIISAHFSTVEVV
jgi:predicted phage tail protein